MERFGRVAAVMGIWALSLTAGCGSFWVYPGSTGTGSGNTGDYVYVANATSGTLAGFAVGTGKLTAVTNSPYSLGFSPTAVAVNPANSIVFVAGTITGNGYIDTFSIGSGGALTLLMNNNVGLADEVSMDVSPDGQWLIGLDGNGLTLDEYQINSSTGQLTLATGATYTVASNAGVVSPRALKFAPNGNYVFAALGTAGDLVFPFNTSSGLLTTPPLQLTLTSGSGNSDNALAVNSASSYLYIARSGVNGGLAVFTIGSGGGLNEVSGSPLASGNQPVSVVGNKAGTDIYVANQVDSSISEYSVASNGTVAVLSPATVATVSLPWALAIDNSGNYLLSLSKAGSPDLTMYSYDSATAGKIDFSTSTATGTAATALATTH